MKDFKAAIRNWLKNYKPKPNQKGPVTISDTLREADEQAERVRQHLEFFDGIM